MSEKNNTRVMPVCSTCNSAQVTKDGVTRWNSNTQMWELSDTYDDSCACDDCNGECDVTFVPVPEAADVATEATTGAPQACPPQPTLDFTANERLREMVNDLDECLRDIRAENLDGSEPYVGELLEKSLTLRLELDEGNAPQEADPCFIGEEHPRYSEWRDEVTEGNTLLGLRAWLEHNPSQDEIRAAIAELETERAVLAEGISETCDSEFDREGRAALARWDDENGAELADLKSQLH